MDTEIEIQRVADRLKETKKEREREKQTDIEGKKERERGEMVQSVGTVEIMNH